MQEHKTQQFAKFFLKDLKEDKSDHKNEKFRIDKFKLNPSLTS